MIKRQFHLSEAEIRAFRKAESATRDGYEMRRLQATRLYGSGWAMRAILEIVGAAENSVRQWVMRYQKGGLEGLRTKWQGQNANQLSAEQREQIKDRLRQYRPLDLQISESVYWTVSDLEVAVERWFGVRYRDEGSYQRLLQLSGFSYQRSAKIYRHQPSQAELAEFEAELEKK
jgi:transposase